MRSILGDHSGDLHYLPSIEEDMGRGILFMYQSEGEGTLPRPFAPYIEPEHVSHGILLRVLSESVSNKKVRIKLAGERIVTFREIGYRDQIIKLEYPIELEEVLSDEGCSLYYEPLDISVSASTVDECKEDFQEVLDFLFEQYAMEADENLTEGAQELKRKLLELTESP